MADLTTGEEIDAALERAKAFDDFPRIVEAVYRPEAGLEFLMLRLSDGRRLLIPREELGELKDATAEQAVDLRIGTHGWMSGGRSWMMGFICRIFWSIGGVKGWVGSRRRRMPVGISL